MYDERSGFRKLSMGGLVSALAGVHLFDNLKQWLFGNGRFLLR